MDPSVNVPVVNVPVVNVFVVNVLEVVRRPGTRKPVVVTAPVGELVMGGVSVPADRDVTVDVTIESLSDGLTVEGFVRTHWEAECRRCLADAGSDLEVAVRELFQVIPIAEEAYQYDGEQLDLAQVARDAILLELPLAPTCRPECAGLCPECGANRNDGDCGHNSAPTDARWGALDALKDQFPD
jgi:uncharacterized protein